MRFTPSLAALMSLGAHVLVGTAVLWPLAAPRVEQGPLLVGDTFELAAPEPIAVSAPSESTPPSAPARGSTTDSTDAPAPARPPAERRALPRAQRRTEAEGPDSTADASTNAGYGALGERAAVDLATAFTRGFPQAASADPLWREASLGPAGEADVLLTLDEAGHLERSEVHGAPSAALASAVRRTLALIGAHEFVAKGKVTKLHLIASVSADTVHDGLHGDVFAIGGSFQKGEGSAFFALAIGRRVDLRVQAR